jgi:fructose-1,6-bisphosphatase/inositol monophosphatase family enzyme
VQAWDIAAGSILCECSGLVVRPLHAEGAAPGGVVVAPAALIEELYALVS